MKKATKVLLVSIIILLSIAVYADVNYNIIGPGEKAYCYLFPFLTPKNTAGCNLPIGEFIGSKNEIEKVKEANLNYQAASILYWKDNDPKMILRFMVDLPESRTVDPEEIPFSERSKLLKTHLWDGKGKISFVATFKSGATIRKRLYDAIDTLSDMTDKYPELFKEASEKVKTLKQDKLDAAGQNLLESVKDENEKKIIENLLFIREIKGITVQSKSQLESLKASRSMIAQIVGNKDFAHLKKDIKNDIEGNIIGIKTDGNKAILVYGIPDGLLTEVRKFVKVGDTYKLYTITSVEHTKSLDEALNKYWDKKLKEKSH